MAEQSNISLPISTQLIRIYEDTQQAGYGEQDMAALYSFIQESKRKIEV
jgi:3-hydroxyisobutyrate dehydrogenase